jgi:hypothetical protein
MLKVFIVLMAAFGFSRGSFADAENRTHEPSAQELQKALKLNHLWQKSGHRQTSEWQPLQDTAAFAYVLMSANEEGSSEVAALRQGIAQNLPAGVKLVILANAADKEAVVAKYSAWIDPARLIVATDSDPDTDNGFWARDSFPIPVIHPKTHKTSLVETTYYRSFHSGPAVAKAVAAHLQQNAPVFVGGNLLADEDGNCFSVNSYRLFDLKATDFGAIFGCKQLHLMDHVAGIGDVDEVLKPLSGHRILTNQVSYKAQLETWGYKVILLPELAGTNRTYANSLIVRDTVFMPTYSVAEDDIATKVYQNLGYKVVGLQSIELSDQMNGSVHCQTMAYPAMTPLHLLQSLGLHEIH